MQKIKNFFNSFRNYGHFIIKYKIKIKILKKGLQNFQKCIIILLALKVIEC